MLVHAWQATFKFSQYNVQMSNLHDEVYTLANAVRKGFEICDSRWEEMATKDKKRCMEDYKNKGQASTENLSKPGNQEKHLKRMRQYLEQKAKSKRDRSAWHSFCKEMRANIKEDRPDIPPREVMSEISRRWQKARTGELAQYLEQDKARYKKDPADRERKSWESRLSSLMGEVRR